MSRILLGGHRGLGCTDHNVYQDIRDIKTLPVENTVESVSQAFDNGASYVEIDVVQSADGVIFVLHNVVPQDHFFGEKIPVDVLNKMNFADIQKYMTGRGQNGKVATFAEILDVVKRKAPKEGSEATPWKVNVELKHLAGSKQPYDDNGFLQKVADNVKAAGLAEGDILYSGFSYNNIKEMSKLSPKSHFGMLFRENKDGDETAEPPAIGIYTDRQDDWRFQYLPFKRNAVDLVQNAWNKEADPQAKLVYMHPEVMSITPEMIDFMAERKLGLNVWAIFENPDKQREEIYRELAYQTTAKQIPLTIITDYLPQMKKLVQDFKLAA